MRLFLKKRAAPLLRKIYTHPFNVGLCNGTLPIPIFRTFLEQDRLYLFDFSRALNLTAIRLGNERHQGVLLRLAQDTVKTEMTFHDKYLSRYQTPTLFQSNQFLVKEKTPVVAQYTGYLLECARNAPIEVAVGSLIPCFFVYSKLGLYMRSRLKQNNPYEQWIASYFKQQFLYATQSIIQVGEELIEEDESTAASNMTTACLQSMEFEILFWDSMLNPSPPTLKSKHRPN